MNHLLFKKGTDINQFDDKIVRDQFFINVIDENGKFGTFFSALRAVLSFYENFTDLLIMMEKQFKLSQFSFLKTVIIDSKIIILRKIIIIKELRKNVPLNSAQNVKISINHWKKGKRKIQNLSRWK